MLPEPGNTPAPVAGVAEAPAPPAAPEAAAGVATPPDYAPVVLKLREHGFNLYGAMTLRRSAANPSAPGAAASASVRSVERDSLPLGEVPYDLSHMSWLLRACPELGTRVLQAVETWETEELPKALLSAEVMKLEAELSDKKRKLEHMLGVSAPSQEAGAAGLGKGKGKAGGGGAGPIVSSKPVAGGSVGSFKYVGKVVSKADVLSEVASQTDNGGQFVMSQCLKVLGLPAGAAKPLRDWYCFATGKPLPVGRPGRRSAGGARGGGRGGGRGRGRGGRGRGRARGDDGIEGAEPKSPKASPDVVEDSGSDEDDGEEEEEAEE